MPMSEEQLRGALRELDETRRFDGFNVERARVECMRQSCCLEIEVREEDIVTDAPSAALPVRRAATERLEEAHPVRTGHTRPVEDNTDEHRATDRDIDELMALRNSNYNLWQRVIALEAALREMGVGQPGIDLSGSLPVIEGSIAESDWPTREVNTVRRHVVR